MIITASNHKAQNMFDHHLKSQFPTYLMKCIDTINDMLSIYMSKIIISFQCFKRLVTSLTNWDSSMSMKDTLYKRKEVRCNVVHQHVLIL